MTTPIGGAALTTIERALDGLARRGEVRADNVANVNTPGFRASRVEFESSLRGAIAAGRPESATTTVVAGGGLPDATGNTVDLEEELVGMMQDNLMRDAMVEGFNFKMNVLRTAIGRR